MLDDIGDVDRVPANSGSFQCGVENFSRRPHKGCACKIFLIAGLLADQYDLRADRAQPENRLCGIGIQIASCAIGGQIAQLREMVAR